MIGDASRGEQNEGQDAESCQASHLRYELQRAREDTLETVLVEHVLMEAIDV